MHIYCIKVSQTNQCLPYQRSGHSFHRCVMKNSHLVLTPSQYYFSLEQSSILGSFACDHLSKTSHYVSLHLQGFLCYF